MASFPSNKPAIHNPEKAASVTTDPAAWPLTIGPDPAGDNYWPTNSRSDTLSQDFGTKTPGVNLGQGLELEVRQSGKAGGAGAAILGPCADEQAKKAHLQGKAGRWSTEGIRDEPPSGTGEDRQEGQLAGSPSVSQFSRGLNVLLVLAIGPLRLS